MNAASRKEFFEQATILRNHIRALDALQNRQYDPSLYMTSVHALSHIAKTELRDLEALLSITNAHSRTLRRIECMDISHLGGSWAAGSIVVATDGIIDSSQYRRFRVKVSSSDDLTMLEEVLRRRLRHDEWQKPDLLVIDGGKPQVGRILRVLEDLNQTIAVVGISKQYEELIIPRNGMMRTLRLPLDRPVMMLIRRLRDEAHRFALRYQRILIRTQYRQSFV
jgi:excinuclease ABC subunit C